jgi:phosphoglycerate dehydrogenase-like enzyme
MSSTLAEYAMMVCLHFAKDVPRLIQQQQQKEWGRFSIVELRGATLGVIGYGDIGRACAKLAKAFGMRVAALRRNPSRNDQDDPYCDIVYGTDALHQLLSESDYIVVSAPLTPESKGMLGREQFACCKKTAVFINVGRGPIFDEDALIEALRTKQIRGAGLDVFCQEPLPLDSPLWELDNVLVSP